MNADKLATHELEGLEHAAPRLLGGVEERDGSLIGRQFLVLPVGEQSADGRIRSPSGYAHAGLAHPGGAGERTANHRGDAEQLHHERRRFGARDLGSEPGKVTAGDMAALMGDDADHLIGRLGGHQRAGMHEHIVPVDDESVEVGVVDDVNVDRLRAETGRAEDRLGVSADQRFGFSIADEAGRVGRGRCDLSGRKSADENRAEPPRFRPDWNLSL